VGLGLDGLVWDLGLGAGMRDLSFLAGREIRFRVRVRWV
jgi:hypothetical protein